MLTKHAIKILALFGAALMVMADTNTQIRKSTTGDNCNTWSIWINEHSPTLIDKSENESLSQDALDEFCPPSAYGKIAEVECKDDKNNVFIGEREDVDHQYHINCDDKNMTVECAPNRADFLQCPDLAIRYFCSCALPTGHDGADDAKSEDTQTCAKLSDTMMIRQFIPIQCTLVVLIILCLVIIALLSKKQIKVGQKSQSLSPL